MADQKQEATYVVRESIINGVLAYLGGRPYVEVVQLVNALGSLPKADDDKRQDSEKAEPAVDTGGADGGDTGGD